MSTREFEQFVVNEWAIFTHPVFNAQLDTLTVQVERLKKKDPLGYTRRNATKRLAAILKLVTEVIPEDPSRPEYRQGQTLGDSHTHWLRAKFFQQYRIFFRYHQKSRVIIIAWVNDEDSKRAYGSNDDAYRVFERMLRNGNPPNDWEQLLAEAKEAARKTQTSLLLGRQ